MFGQDFCTRRMMKTGRLNVMPTLLLLKTLIHFYQLEECYFCTSLRPLGLTCTRKVFEQGNKNSQETSHLSQNDRPLTIFSELRTSEGHTITFQDV